MKKLAFFLIPLVGLFCLTPYMNAAAALLSGVCIAVICGNPFVDHTKLYTHKLLTWSVVGLGAGMNLTVVARVGAQGIGYTVVSIASTLFVGYLIAKALHVEKEAGTLIVVGTAICGGSAIAAIAPTIRAKPQSISVAMGTVFLLNAAALVLFPWLGHILKMGQTQFGLWSALAIHDTSSVVGATLQYGPKALQVGTTVKLARALWIVPLTLLSGYMFNRAEAATANKTKHKYPLFILGFLLVAAIVTWIPQIQAAGHVVELIARRTLVLTLFLIGANLTLTTLQAVGVKPFIQGFVLWIAVGSATLSAVLLGWIH